ncbi:hypothetical protein WICPIJ_004072 [Wickerhamomyces pijperi]|uniref:Uncharacterized protein n=1 Tax=Wickerhamomyces pijperi TaxID=599730 RepID=A0A9P8TN46_WICPI|nr:hypothetical protein WICPIJ_004072 [Wickerhamomyces pijperi]
MALVLKNSIESKVYLNEFVFSKYCKANSLMLSSCVRCFKIPIKDKSFEERKEWIIGKENLPSEISSQNPLFSFSFSSFKFK